MSQVLLMIVPLMIVASGPFYNIFHQLGAPMALTVALGLEQ
ncbi:MAG: hypothetical protein AAF171_06335 [Cyanobacteria bacterium P01_A01_bin.116]